jgi:hypothetical protein
MRSTQILGKRADRGWGKVNNHSYRTSGCGRATNVWSTEYSVSEWVSEWVCVWNTQPTEHYQLQPVAAERIICLRGVFHCVYCTFSLDITSTEMLNTVATQLYGGYVMPMFCLMLTHHPRGIVTTTHTSYSVTTQRVTVTTVLLKSNTFLMFCWPCTFNVLLTVHF